MCGKPNSEDAHICQFCGARLSPVIPENKTPMDSSSDDQVSWLRDLRGDEDNRGNALPTNEGDHNIISPHEESQDDTPDWLDRVRYKNLMDQRSEALNFKKNSGEEKDSQNGADTAAGKPSSSEGSNSDEDWLGKLRNFGADEPLSESENQNLAAESEEESAEPFEDEEQFLDRLGALNPYENSSTESDQESPDQEEFGSGEGSTLESNGLESWLKSLDQEDDLPSVKSQNQSEPEPEPDSSFENPQEIEFPIWMMDEMQTAFSAQTEEEKEETGSESEQPTFAEENEPESQLPDWLSQLNQNAAEADSGQLLSSEENPDWLNDIELEPASEEETPVTADADLPDWLRTSIEPQPEEKDAEAEEIPAQEEPEPILQNWFSEIEDEIPTPDQPESDLPDWMLAVTGTESDIEEPATKPAEIASEQPEETQAPDWLANLNIEPDQFEDEPQIEALKDGAPGILGDIDAIVPGDWAFDSDSNSEMDDAAWQEAEPEIPADRINPLKNQAQEEQLSPQSEKVSPFFMDDLPDWMSDLSNTPAFIQDEELEDQQLSSNPFTEEKMPIWLSEEAEMEGLEAIEGQSEEEMSEDVLSPVQMPGWLQAMRPVEAVIPGKSPKEKTSKVESAGPLAGLQGVLPADDLVTRYRKPPVYSNKLRVSEKQREHVSLLEDILLQEGTPKATSKAKFQSPQRLLRIIIGLLLMVVILFPMLTNSTRIPIYAANPPVYVQNFSQAIESLPENSSVLLVFDYDPGYSGEMRFAASGMLERLMIKGARLSIVSSVAAGPALGEDMLASAYQKLVDQNPSLVQGYSLDTQSVNLGYLAGGTASLQEFALNPRQAAKYGLEPDRNGTELWNSPILQGIQNVKDYSAVIVLTDSNDTGRAWVEQVQPVLENTPLLMVSSAQAAPLIQPYLQSGQVQGMLAGLQDGMTYSQMVEVPGESVVYYNSYQSAISVVIALVLLGIFFELISGIFTRSGTKSEA